MPDACAERIGPADIDDRRQAEIGRQILSAAHGAPVHDPQALLINGQMGFGRGAVRGLPMHAFELTRQWEAAFRLLQSGRNIGKVVVRVSISSGASGAGMVAGGTQLLTGGTGGLGLLTAR